MHNLALLERSAALATIKLNRPEARNALSVDLLKAITARVHDLAASPPTVLCITGAGNAFCAGMDLKLVVNNAAAASELLRELALLLVTIRSLPCVVVGKVNGAAIGGGCGLACVCDVVITHADAKLGFPEVDLGVCPAVVAPWLVRKIGAGRARRVLLSGGFMTGTQAGEIGIADHVVPDRIALDHAADELCSRLGAGGPNALAATKTLLNELDGSLDRDQAVRGADLSARVLVSDEARAMLTAKLKL